MARATPKGVAFSNGRENARVPANRYRAFILRLFARDDVDHVAAMFVEERETVHHPRIETVSRVLQDLRDDVQPISQPPQLAAGGCWEDRPFTVVAVVAVLSYVFAIVSETSCSVV